MSQSSDPNQQTAEPILQRLIDWWVMTIWWRITGRWFKKGLRWPWLLRFFKWLHYPDDSKMIAVLGPNLFIVDRWSGSRTVSSPIWDRSMFRSWKRRFLTWIGVRKENTDLGDYID